MISFLVFGEEPRPRVLIHGFDDDETAGRIGELVPTSKVIADLDEIHQPEWDVLVTSEGVPYNLEDHIYVVGFGTTFGDYDGGNGGITRSTLETRAREFEVPRDLPDHVSSLVRRDLLVTARVNEVNHPLRPSWYGTRGTSYGPRPDVLIPFLRTREPEILAGRFPRPEGHAETWAIGPSSEPVAWVRAALIEWHRHDPIRFPIDLSWRSDHRWLTVEELRVRDEIQKLDAETQRVLSDLQQQRRELEAKLSEAQERADSGSRRLLTAKGVPLVEAVAHSLRSMGFDVEDRDEQADRGDNLEDLLVRDPGEPGWEALVEVRGYNRGARASDLQRIGRFVLRRVQEGQGEPTGRWYIVNQFVGQDPATRQRPIPNDADVKTFSDDRGLIIDTAEFYRLSRDVQLGVTTLTYARSTLREQTGRFEYGQPTLQPRSSPGLPRSTTVQVE